MFRQRPSEVLSWSAWEIELLAEFLRKEPCGEDRVEIAIAELAAIYVNAHRKKGAQPHKVDEFLLFHNAWKADDPEPDEGLGGLLLSFGKVRKRG